MMTISTLSAFLLVSLGLPAVSHAAAAVVEDDTLTYGSVVKLQHVDSKYFLHSHQINWGSGSGQQSVTGHGSPDDQGGLWIIKEANEGPFHEVGSPIKCGDIVRLTHLETDHNLHTHLFNSPLSNQQEVSCFGENGQGDTGDNWEVICKGTTWRRDQDVRLKHKDTGKYLSSQAQHRFNQRNCPNCPIIGQQEIVCVGSMSSTTAWRAVQGVFFHPKGPEDKDEL